ncbi:hypothetical protein EJ110_NYTH36740 [Nymphaea thermarum]|nr:hypothetical protein EJ110_NYTH36740 [Nymphaea thermarum]
MVSRAVCHTYKRCGNGETEQEIQMEHTMEGTSLVEVAVPFFQSVTLPQSAVTTEECFVEMAKLNVHFSYCESNILLVPIEKGVGQGLRREKDLGWPLLKSKSRGAWAKMGHGLSRPNAHP